MDLKRERERASERLWNVGSSWTSFAWREERCSMGGQAFSFQSIYGFKKAGLRIYRGWIRRLPHSTKPLLNSFLSIVAHARREEFCIMCIQENGQNTGDKKTLQQKYCRKRRVSELYIETKSPVSREFRENLVSHTFYIHIRICTISSIRTLLTIGAETRNRSKREERERESERARARARERKWT